MENLMNIKSSLFGFALVLVAVPLVYANLPVFTKSFISPQQSVERNRAELIKHASLASLASYNQIEEIIPYSSPKRGVADVALSGNARKIMHGLGENVYTFGANDMADAGLISVNTSYDKVQITIAFHGTESNADLIADAKFFKQQNKVLSKTGSIHGGFNERYMAIRSSLMNKLMLVMEHNNLKVEDVEFVITGHSLGGALATLAALDIRLNVLKENEGKLKLVTFSSPRTLDVAGAAEFELVVGEGQALRIWIDKDPIVAGLSNTLFGLKHVGLSIKLESDSYILNMKNHKLTTILELAYKQEDVNFVEKQVGVKDSMYNAARSFFASTITRFGW